MSTDQYFDIVPYIEAVKKLMLAILQLLVARHGTLCHDRLNMQNSVQASCTPPSWLNTEWEGVPHPSSSQYSNIIFTK